MKYDVVIEEVKFLREIYRRVVIYISVFYFKD